MCSDPGTHSIAAAQEERLRGPLLKAPKLAPAGLISRSDIIDTCVTLGQIPLPVYTSIFPSAKGDDNSSIGYCEDETNTHEESKRAMTHN